MKNKGPDRLVKILLSTGTAIHMYADKAAVSKMTSSSKFIRFKDDGNENVLIAIAHIAGFEILDERTDMVEQQAPAVQSEPVMLE